MIPGLGDALQQLTIEAYTDPERRSLDETFTVAFNPSTVNVQNGTNLDTQPGAQGSSGRARYLASQPRHIRFSIVIDGTGASEPPFGAAMVNPISGSGPPVIVPVSIPPVGAPGPADVPRDVDKFLELCWNQVSDRHEPRYLNISWGPSGFPLRNFSCRLMRADVTYGTFSSDGKPAYAQIDACFVEDREPEERSSPDLTHRRMVKAGDTLPSMCREIYGSPVYYIRVAQFNDLDSVRDITPGMLIDFPPLA